MVKGESKGLIFDIQGHALHDGPGTRTLVFLGGCPLRCKWCANPEGQLLRPRLMYKANLCKDCPFRCVQACPKGAARCSASGHPPVIFDRGACDRCDRMECLGACYRQALQASAKWYTVNELMRLLERDRSYWGEEGGVTLSGGEPLTQPTFVRELLKACREAMISACVETSAYVPRPVLEAVLPLVDWLFVDLKHMDSKKHREGTGAPNELVLENIRWITLSGWTGRLIVRAPVVADFNDTAENAKATAGFLKEVGVGEIHLLPFHRLGASKYEKMGMRYEFSEQPAMAAEELEPLAKVYRRDGITCHVGAETPF